MSAIQTKNDNELIRIANLELLWKNITGNVSLNHVMNGFSLDVLSGYSKSSSLLTIVDRLSHIINEYKTIVANLPQGMLCLLIFMLQFE